MTRGLPGMHAPLVGRDRELDLLAERSRSASSPSSRPQLVNRFTATPGVGKSRLVRELLGRLRDAPDPPRIVVGRCLSYGDGDHLLAVRRDLEDVERRHRRRLC